MIPEAAFLFFVPVPAQLPPPSLPLSAEQTKTVAAPRPWEQPPFLFVSQTKEEAPILGTATVFVCFANKKNPIHQANGIKTRKNKSFLKKYWKIFGGIKKSSYLCIAFEK